MVKFSWKLRNAIHKLIQMNPLSSGIKISELRNARYEIVHMQKQSSDTRILEFRKTKLCWSYLLGASYSVLSFYLWLSSGTPIKIHHIEKFFICSSWLGSAPPRWKSPAILKVCDQSWFLIVLREIVSQSVVNISVGTIILLASFFIDQQFISARWECCTHTRLPWYSLTIPTIAKMLRAAKPIASEKKGAKVVKIKCSQCHTNGYSYSTANQTSGITWDAGTSFEYLNNPLIQW